MDILKFSSVTERILRMIIVGNVKRVRSIRYEQPHCKIFKMNYCEIHTPLILFTNFKLEISKIINIIESFESIKNIRTKDSTRRLDGVQLHDSDFDDTVRSAERGKSATVLQIDKKRLRRAALSIQPSRKILTMSWTLNIGKSLLYE